MKSPLNHTKYLGRHHSNPTLDDLKPKRLDSAERMRFKLLAPLVVPVFVSISIGSIQFVNYLVGLSDTPANAQTTNLDTKNFDVLPLTSVEEGKSAKSKSYLADGVREDFATKDTISRDVIIPITPTPAQQFVIKSKQDASLIVETSGDAVKVIKDLDPKGAKKPYYSATTCTWKDKNIKKACPIKKFELHLYSNSTSEDGLLTNRPANTNDREENPAVVEAISQTTYREAGQ